MSSLYCQFGLIKAQTDEGDLGEDRLNAVEHILSRMAIDREERHQLVYGAVNISGHST